MPVCANCGQDNPDVARFCLACGSPLAEAAPVAPAEPSEERKLITAVFVDLVGSTARSEQLDVEDVKALVAPYHARVRAELERHGGVFEKFSGDAILALFGAPKAHEDDPERAVRAALATREAIAELNAEDEWLNLHIRTGVHTGEALVMLQARASEGEWTAAGDVLNTAARIQSAAPTDGILVGELTYRATRHAIEYRDAEPVAAKGKSEPVRVWEVVGARSVSAPRVAARLPLVGRDAELEELEAFCRGMLEQATPAVATVMGPPGIGKTRLIAELTDHLRSAGTSDVLRGRCLSYGEGITYWPIVEIVKAAAGILVDDDAERESRKLGAMIDSFDTTAADELRTIATSLANLLGVDATPLGTYSAETISQAELHWGIRRLLELRAAQQPTVVLVEDLHWAEPTLLDLLTFISASEAAVPLLVLTTARAEAKDSGSPLFVQEANRFCLELESLTDEQAEAFVAALVENVELGGTRVETVLRNAGGNPLFIEETVRMLAQAGERPEGADAIAVPATLQALIASRLDQLEPPTKRLAQHASVLGAVFWVGAVAELHESAADLDSELTALEERDFVRAAETSTLAGEEEFAFKHILIRDVAYSQLPKGRRSVLHSRFADWVEALPVGSDDFAEIIAYHLEQACLLVRNVARPAEPPPTAKAVDALVRAAERAERREGHREADRFYERALVVLGDADPGLTAKLDLQRAKIVSVEGRLKEACEQLTEVETAARELRRNDLLCETLIALANVDMKQGRAEEAKTRLTEAEELALALGDLCLQIRAAFESSLVRAWFEGASDGPVEELERALALAREIGDRALEIEGEMRLGNLFLNTGELARAEERLAVCVARAGELGSHRDEARGTSMLAFVRYYRGDTEQAERLTEQALAWLERTSDSYLQIQNARNLAKYALVRGEADAAERRLRAALPLALEVGGWIVTDVYRYLAEALVQQGRLEDATDLLAFAVRSVPAEDAYARAALLLAEAAVATASNEQATAATSFAEALRLLEEQQLWIDLGEARLALARSLRAFGDTAGARTELERARVGFARMEARGLVDQIDRELGELEEAGAVPASSGSGSS